MGITIGFNSQRLIPNPETVVLYDPRHPNNRFTVAEANRHDRGVTDDPVMAARIAQGKTLWTVGYDQLLAAGSPPPEEDWVLTDGDGTDYVVDMIDRSDVLRFYRLTTTGRPNRKQ